MNHKHLLSALTVTAALSSVLFLAAPVAAQTVTPPPTAQASKNEERRIINGDRTNFGGDFTLRATETLRGDLAIFGGNVQLEQGSVVEGDVALFGGNLNVAGTINGDLVQLGGSVRLQRSARVEGKAERVGGSRSEEPGAFIGKGGTDVIIPNLPAIPALPGAAATADNFDGDVPVAPGAPEAPLPAPTQQPSDPLSRAEQAIERLGRNARVNVDNGNNNAWKVLPGALLITLLAMLIASIAPRNIALASEVARTQPLLSGGVGLLSLIAGDARGDGPADADRGRSVGLRLRRDRSRRVRAHARWHAALCACALCAELRAVEYGHGALRTAAAPCAAGRAVT